MGWTVYILRCGDGTLYTGCTNDLPRRLAAHRSGRGAKYTRSRLPVEPVYREEAADKSAALRREAAIKRLDRRKKLALIGDQAGQEGELEVRLPGHCPPGVLGRHPRRALGGGPGSARMGYPRPDRGGAAGREVLYRHIE